MMQAPLRRNWLWICAICLLLFVLVAVVSDMALVQVRHRIRPGFDTTRITSPKLPDGRIDYLAAFEQLASQGVTSENNAAIPLLQAFGRAALAFSKPPDGITNKLGMPPLHQAGDYLITSDHFAAKHPELPAPKYIFLFAVSNSPIKTRPFAREWTKANQHPLDLIVEGAKRPRFYIPFNNGDLLNNGDWPRLLCNLQLPYLSSFREASYCLLTRALIRMDAGDFAGFRLDIQTVHRLAGLLGQSHTVMERFVATDLDNAACKATRAAAAGGKLSVAQLRTLSQDLDGLRNLPSFDDAIEGERFRVLDFMQAMAVLPPDQSAEIFNRFMITPNGSASVLRFLPIPYEDAMRNMNSLYDSALVALDQPDYPQQTAVLNQWWKQFVNDSDKPFLVRMLSSQFGASELMLSAPSLADDEAKGRTQRRLTRIALALAEYKSEHDGYPQTLAELSPNYLKKVPNDIFTDRPLIYTQKPAGYALSSAGPDSSTPAGRIFPIIANVP